MELENVAARLVQLRGDVDDRASLECRVRAQIAVGRESHDQIDAGQVLAGPGTAVDAPGQERVGAAALKLALDVTGAGEDGRHEIRFHTVL